MIFWIIFAKLLGIVTAADPNINFPNPCRYYVGENGLARNQILDYVTVSDADGDLFQCEIREIKGDNGGKTNDEDEFTFMPNPRHGPGAYNFELAPGAAPPEIGKTPYEIKLRCEEVDGGDKDERTCEVHIIAGDDCQWDPPIQLPYTTPKRDAKTILGGDTIDTITASTTSGSAITSYEILDVWPALPGGSWTAFFEMDATTGAITAKQNLYNISREWGPSWRFDIKAEAANNLRCYGFYTLTFQNQNFRPMSYENMADTVSEMTPVGTTLFEIRPWNPEGDQTVTVRNFNCDNNGNRLFNIEFPQNNIILGSALDFETMATTFTCTLDLFDGYHDSPVTYTMTLSQFNVNEPPVFQHEYYYATFSEGAGFAVTVDPNPVCTDVESTVTYELCNSGNSSRFRVTNANTGELTLAANYDIDNAWPIRDVIELCCIDSGDIAGNKLTATAKLVVAINDISDNPPELSDRGYLWYADGTMEAGTTLLGSLVSTDADLWAINRNTKCSATSPSNATLAAYFSWTTKCQLFLRKTIDYDPGTLVRFVVTVEDQGNPASLSTTVTVDVISQDTATTTTTTTTIATTPYNFWDDTGSCVVFGLTMFGIAALLGVLLYVLLRGWLYGWNNLWPRCTCCRYRRYPVKGPVTPPSTPPPREKTPIIREIPRTPVVVQRPQEPILVKRTVLRPRIIAQPMGAPIVPMQGIPPSLLRR